LLASSDGKTLPVFTEKTKTSLTQAIPEFIIGSSEVSLITDADKALKMMQPSSRTNW
jgi:hypothetical protein